MVVASFYRPVWITLCSAVVWVVFSLVGPSHVAGAEEFKIGVVIPLTGLGQRWVESARRGIELGIEEFQRKDPALTSFRAIFEDSRSQAGGAISAYRKLVDQDHVDVVVGDVWAFLTMPLIPLADRDRMVLISPTVMRESVTANSPFFFTFGHQFAESHAAVDRFFELNPSVKDIGCISYEDPWNNAFLKLVRDVATKRAISVKKEMQAADYSSDFRTEVAALRASSPEAVFSTWRPDSVLRRMMELKWHVPYLTSSDMVEAARIRMPQAGLYENAYFLDWPPSQNFIELFKKNFGSEPVLESHNAYEIIRTLAKALKQKGSNLRSKLYKVSYEGEGGPIDFRAAPFVNGAKGQLFQVKNNEFVNVMSR